MFGLTDPAHANATEVVFQEDPLGGILSLIRTSHHAICNYVLDHELSLMGTTAAMVVFAGDEAVICNVGDSKIFRFQNNTLKQISHDHVGKPKEGKKPPLTQCLGMPGEKNIIPHIVREDLAENTSYLICSDGLTDMVSYEAIESHLNYDSIADVAGKLMEEALVNGGRDNITLILCRVENENKS